MGTYCRSVLAASSRPTVVRFEASRLGLLDLLRLGAAFAVVAYHYTAFRHPGFGVSVDRVFPTVGVVTGLGALGVQLFFLISGFVILMSLWDRSIHDFTASRIARLFPAYWLAVLSTGALMVLFQPEVLTEQYGWEASVSQLFANLTMVQEALAVQPMDGVYWTLFVELKFYVAVGLLSLFGLTRGRVIAFAVFWPLLGELASTADAPLASALLGGRHAAFFSAGMLIYLLHREGHSPIVWLLLGMQWAVAMKHSGTDLVSVINNNTGRDFQPTTVMIVVSLCFVLVLVATLTRLRDVSARWMALAGGLTYPLYLIHENWGWVIISATHERIGQLCALGLAILLSLLAAAMIHVFVERPLTPRLRRVIRMGLQDLQEPRPQIGQPTQERLDERTALEVHVSHGQSAVRPKPETVPPSSPPDSLPETTVGRLPCVTAATPRRQ